MTKSDFLRQLIIELKDLPKEERENAISYYEEYFSDAGEENEAEIMIGLGSPKDIANQIIKTYNQKNVPTIKKQHSVSMIILWIFAFPILLPLALALFLVILSLFIVYFTLLFVLYLLSIVFGLCALIYFIGGLITLFLHAPTGILLFGVSFILIGFTILFHMLAVITTTKSWRGIIKLFKYIKGRIVKNEK